MRGDSLRLSHGAWCMESANGVGDKSANGVGDKHGRFAVAGRFRKA